MTEWPTKNLRRAEHFAQTKYCATNPAWLGLELGSLGSFPLYISLPDIVPPDIFPAGLFASYLGKLALTDTLDPNSLTVP